MKKKTTNTNTGGISPTSARQIKSHHAKSGLTQTHIGMRIDNTNLERMKDVTNNRNGFINAAIREKLDREHPIGE